MNQTDNTPDFTNYGYQIIRKLGQNKEHSSISWQGKAINNNTPVIIKQFRFATQDSSWSGYQAYQREIDILQKLKHPGIPKYIASFETDNSFCFVREYIAGQSLAEKINLTIKDIKKIVVKVLDILIYLQQKQPPILHLNITPDNILLDNKSNVYLINFSRAQTTETEVDYSSITTSNAEFIAPEQLSTPGSASDNYGLGCTLNKVINQQRSLALVSTNDFENPVSLSELDSGFQEWLTKMTESEVDDRYPDAETAFQALKKSSWDEIETVTQSAENIALSDPTFATGIATMAILGIAIAVGINVTQRVTEKSFVNITIALMGMVIIYLTQSASATLITNDNAEKKQSITLAVATPIILAIITGIIFGRGEAVAMSLAAIIAQTATLSHVLLQKLPLNRQDNIVKAIGLVIAIAFGLVCGLAIQ